MESFTQPQIFDQDYFTVPQPPKRQMPTKALEPRQTPSKALVVPTGLPVRSESPKASVEQRTASNRELTAVESGRLLNILTNSRSENTNAAYRRAWAAFVRWTQEQGFTALPAEPTVIALYLDSLNEDGRRISTLTQGLSAITAAHSDAGHKQDFFHNNLVAAALRSAKRDMARDGRSLVSKPRAFRQSEILAMVEAMPDTPQGARDKAILAMGVNAGLRASEYAALNVSDITIDAEGMDIRIRSSKTDQEGQSELVYVSRLAPAQRAFDAVSAMESWLSARGTIEGPLFIAYRKGGQTPHLIEGKVHGVGRDAVTAVLTRAFTRAGLTGRLPSSHSLRHSFITQAFARHLDATRIAKVSRHKNLRTLIAYDQSSRKANPVSSGLWN
ncbi:tyrosine-type recombinase/integrase [Citricoccus nitrophenolicus]|uniref:tyrosine-type recombinase/integrase n=1 Tax=Citricoccus nitrophenolicus TaxID=863575 RepID=UPI0031EEF20D